MTQPPDDLGPIYQRVLDMKPPASSVAREWLLAGFAQSNLNPSNEVLGVLATKAANGESLE